MLSPNPHTYARHGAKAGLVVALLGGFTICGNFISGITQEPSQPYLLRRIDNLTRTLNSKITLEEVTESTLAQVQSLEQERTKLIEQYHSSPQKREYEEKRLAFVQFYNYTNVGAIVATLAGLGILYSSLRSLRKKTIAPSINDPSIEDKVDGSDHVVLQFRR